MVRRRTRIEKNNSGNIYAIGTEDQNFVSPKRKDAKLDDATVVIPGSEMTPKLSAKLKAPILNKTRADRIGGRTIGVPLATRSQTRTIENFFKAKTAQRLKETKENKTSSDLNTLPIEEKHSPCGTPDNELTENHRYDFSQTDFIFELSELSSEAITDEATADFDTHRARDSCSSHSSSSSSNKTDNIFLQEPVLTLNVDKTLNQASSIKINNSLTIAEPVFSSPCSLTAVGLHGRFDQIVSLTRLSPGNNRSSFEFEKNNTTAMLLVPEIESSSSDSGVALETVEQNSSLPQEVWPAMPVDLEQRRRKPTTPHRILCPSPIKMLSHVGSPAGISQSVRNSTSSKEQMSPRKAQRNLSVDPAALMTRRRLNANLQEDLNTPQPIKNVKTKEIEKGCDLQSENQIQDFESASDIAFYGTSNDLKPSIILKNNKSIDPLKQPLITTAKTVQPKSRNQKSFLATKPLAATNGNRELSEFFPVRRSVRKTKTAVREEIMRNFEKAILEQRADGLRVEYFEGKGRGIVAERRFERGEFVIEYDGDFINVSEAAEREKRYAIEDAGCYMYYFRHRNQQYCIDATADTGKFGRLLNHSRNGNLITKVIEMKKRPHLILIAKDDIQAGDELTYDYGDRSKVSLLHHPWLAF